MGRPSQNQLVVDVMLGVIIPSIIDELIVEDRGLRLQIFAQNMLGPT